MRDDAPSRSALLLTAPSEAERRYHLAVSLQLRTKPQMVLHPWVQITANAITEDITCSAGIKAAHIEDDEDDDGA